MRSAFVNWSTLLEALRACLFDETKHIGAGSGNTNFDTLSQPFSTWNQWLRLDDRKGISLPPLTHVLYLSPSSTVGSCRFAKAAVMTKDKGYAPVSSSSPPIE